MHSQNKEAEVVLNYFNGKTGTVLDVGANDGITFSNSYDLLKGMEWYGVLFEPGMVYDSLWNLHKNNEQVHTFRMGIGEREEVVKFYQSGAHVKGGKDTGLVSTTDIKETIKWKKAGVEFKEVSIQLVPFTWVSEKYPVFDFISLDVEGMDWQVLKQIDLTKVGCKCICIEWNSDKMAGRLFSDYITRFGLREIHRNAENLIFAI